MADNVQPQFNRNYGAMVTAKEFWGGNNGFITLGIQMPATAGGVAYELADSSMDDLALKVKNGTATDVEILRVSNAQRNLFRVAQAVSQRAVLVAISGCKQAASAGETLATGMVPPADLTKVGVGYDLLAYSASAGTGIAHSVKPIYYVTFMIERADAFNAQSEKPGSNPPLSVDPAAELVKNITNTGFFESDKFTQHPDGSPAYYIDYTNPAAPVEVRGARAGAAAVAVKVFDSLPILK